jgi:ATP-dependent DNA ligase
MIEVVEVSAASFAPMLATLGRAPAGEGWAWEMKFDGQLL